MDAHIKDVIEEATRASDEERVTFGEVVLKLTHAGVERYHADLLRGEKTYYLPDGELAVVAGAPSPLLRRTRFQRRASTRRCATFKPARFNIAPFVRASLRPAASAIMCPLPDSAPFYYGRTGDCHVEWFPGAKREQAA